MKKSMLSLVMLVFAGITLSAQKPQVYIKDGKAIRGYDPVAYFTEKKAIKGNDSLVYGWNNASWYFSSRNNLELFKAEPEKYTPQYGGYCAYGLSNGYKAPTDADAWTIDNGKLYLNYSLEVRRLWDKERKQRIEKADKNWPEVQKQ